MNAARAVTAITNAGSGSGLVFTGRRLKGAILGNRAVTSCAVGVPPSVIHDGCGNAEVRAA